MSRVVLRTRNSQVLEVSPHSSLFCYLPLLLRHRKLMFAQLKQLQGLLWKLPKQGNNLPHTVAQGRSDLVLRFPVLIDSILEHSREATVHMSAVLAASLFIFHGLHLPVTSTLRFMVRNIFVRKLESWARIPLEPRIYVYFFNLRLFYPVLVDTFRRAYLPSSDSYQLRERLIVIRLFLKGEQVRGPNLICQCRRRISAYWRFKKGSIFPVLN